MKKLLALVLILGIASVTNAAMVGLVAPAPGEPGSIENPLVKSDTITIQIVSVGGPLLALGADVTVEGPGSLVDAGYNVAGDPTFTRAPIVEGQRALLAVGDFNGVGSNPGYLVFHCDGEGLVLIGIGPNVAVGGSIDGTTFGPVEGYLPAITIHQVPEPMTMSLLGLGGLALIRRRRA
jgi:hypothetical protein